VSICDPLCFLRIGWEASDFLHSLDIVYFHNGCVEKGTHYVFPIRWIGSFMIYISMDGGSVTFLSWMVLKMAFCINRSDGCTMGYMGH
jgi:hypothetical protein